MFIQIGAILTIFRLFEIVRAVRIFIPLDGCVDTLHIKVKDMVHHKRYGSMDLALELLPELLLELLLVLLFLLLLCEFTT